MNRLEIGTWGTGSLTVSAGALIDATLNAAACSAPGAFCYSFIGNAAGSTGTLTVTGAGSEVRALRNFVVGQTAVNTQALNGFDFGTPGGTTNAFVNVLNGGTLRTEQALFASISNSPAALGTERANATVVIDGAGSRWVVTHNSVDNREAFVTAGNGANARATIDIRNGGKMIIDGSGRPSVNNDGINLGVNGGRADLTVSGIGSSLEVKGNSPVIQVGRSGVGAQGSFSVLAGATAASLFLNVGRDSASGSVLIDGAGSQLSLVGVGSGAAFANFGRGGGTGQGTVSNGGRLFISDGGADSRAGTGSPGMNIGRDAASPGKLTITGPGSTVQIVSSSIAPAAGVTDNFNSFVAVGRFAGASGELIVANGGKLLMEGNALSTGVNPRGTNLYIGGASDSVAGGNGKALVTGAGSEIRLTGVDTFIAVGQGAGAVGELTVANSGSVSAGVVNVGRAGGRGNLTLDSATLNLSGQYTSDPVVGAVLSVGNRGGTGVATIANGSQVNITNLGSAGASLNLGGTGLNPLGNGTLTVSGGSQINLTAASGLATFSVARDGTALATIKEASSINLGDGATYIGRLAGSNGTLVLEGGSALNAGYVGVGRTQKGPTGVDGGSGRLIVNSGSVVTASSIEIGSNGFLGGDGTIVGDVTLHGVLSPGNSPARIVIDGRLATGSGHLILEVGRSGDAFVTDQVVLTRGSTFNFTGLEVTFSFLDGIDPNAFAASGAFDLDNFLQSLDKTTGAITGLSSVFTAGQTWQTVFATATFDAVADDYVITGLTFSADGGATVTAVPSIPEPGTWALMFAGLAAVAAIARRRSRSTAAALA